MGSSENMRSFGHASAILERINADDPPEVVAKRLTGYFSALILDMQGEYCPTWPKYSNASYNSNLKDWKNAVDRIEDPALRSEVVLEAMKKWSHTLATIEYTHKVIPRDVILGHITDAFKKHKVPNAEENANLALHEQSRRVKEMVSVADEKLSGLMESNQEAVYAAMGKVTRGDFDVMLKYARQSDLKQYNNMQFSHVPDNVLIFN